METPEAALPSGNGTVFPRKCDVHDIPVTNRHVLEPPPTLSHAGSAPPVNSVTAAALGGCSVRAGHLPRRAGERRRPALSPQTSWKRPEKTGAGRTIFARNQIAVACANQKLIAVANAAVGGNRQFAIIRRRRLESTIARGLWLHAMAYGSARTMLPAERCPGRAVPRVIDVTVTTANDPVAVAKLERRHRRGRGRRAPRIGVLRLRAEREFPGLDRSLTIASATIAGHPVGRTALGAGAEHDYIALAVGRSAWRACLFASRQHTRERCNAQEQEDCSVAPKHSWPSRATRGLFCLPHGARSRTGPANPRRHRHFMSNVRAAGDSPAAAAFAPEDDGGDAVVFAEAAMSYRQWLIARSDARSCSQGRFPRSRWVSSSWPVAAATPHQFFRR
jgi:hypothetical protein